MQIQDLNLKLAIIQELRDLKKLPKFDKKKFWKETFGKKYDFLEEYNYREVPEVVAYYENYEIPAELYAEIETLFWFPSYIKSGMNIKKIHHDIFDQWDGEASQFQIASLEGVELCQNLKELKLDALGIYSQGKWDRPTTYVSLKPLQALAKLENLMLYDALVQDLEVILEIKSSKKIKLSHVDSLEKTDLEKLKINLENKGVIVEMKN